MRNPAMDRQPHDRQAGIERLRAWFLALSPRGRIILAVALAAVLVVLAVRGTTPSHEVTISLYGGHVFAPRQAAEIVRVLEAGGIDAQSIDGRVEVASLQRDDAHEAVARAGLAPSSMKALVDAVPAGSLLATSAEIEQQRNRHRERLLEQAIQEIDPSLSAAVMLFREPPRGLSRTERARVTIWLELATQQAVSSQVIERITWTTRAWIPELQDDGLMLLDSTGRPYVLSGHPAIQERSELRAREEELRGLILERLDWIAGARVAVTLVPNDVAALPASDPASKTSEAPQQPAVSANVSLDEWPAVSSDLPIQVVAARPLPSQAPTDTTANEPTPTESVDSSPLAHVLVRVPNTYYTQLAGAVPGQPPRAGDVEELRLLVQQTEGAIHNSVTSVIPPSQQGDIVIERIYLPSTPGRQRTSIVLGTEWFTRWQTAAGAAVATLAIVAAAAVLVSGSRGRQGRAQAASPRGRASHTHRVDQPDVAAPSERVQALIRLDPSAAASVLQRWIGSEASGGGSSS